MLNKSPCKMFYKKIPMILKQYKLVPVYHVARKAIKSLQSNNNSFSDILRLQRTKYY